MQDVKKTYDGKLKVKRQGKTRTRKQENSNPLWRHVRRVRENTVQEGSWSGSTVSGKKIWKK